MNRIQKMINDIVETGKAFSHIDNDDSEFLEKFPDIKTTSQTGSDIVYTSFFHKKEKFLLRVMNFLDKSDLKQIKPFCESIALKFKCDDVEVQWAIAEAFSDKKDYIRLFLLCMEFVTEENFNLIQESFEEIFVS
jgi:hypothetical protein